MSKRADFVQTQQRASRRFFFVLTPIVCTLILVVNIVQDASAGRQFNWFNLLMVGVIAAGSGVIYLVSSLMFRFTLEILDEEPSR